ncbi:MAG: DUF1573 domain-containing protein [Anaerolineae bacterium]
MAKKKQRASQRRRSDRRTSRGPGLTSRPGFWVIGLGAAFLVVGIGILLLARQRAQGAPLPTVEQLTVEGDVVTGDTVVGIHEMGAPEIPTAPIPPEGPPRLVLPEQFHDFGAIPATDKVDYTFPVRNNGKGALTISRIYTTCGCTTAELSSRVIPPGKQATLKVIYDPAFHDVEGEVRRSVILETNDPEWGGQVEVSIQANVQK